MRHLGWSALLLFMGLAVAAPVQTTQAEECAGPVVAPIGFTELPIGASYEPGVDGCGVLVIANALGTHFSVINSRGELVFDAIAPSNLESFWVPNTGADSMGTWLTLLTSEGLLDVSGPDWEWIRH